ncbi:MAG: acetyl-CoA decarbonylase/synthase complex subunit gamma [Methanosarcinaceae archaeon]|jgi:acetyl-CoA decarbonylase/synthase complex subunit gamma|nr:acetyl-CoA decarbonylase/synthase complex subunit gamma [Methanosarcinaceae archaeon]
MAKKKLGPLAIYKFLPKINCKKCGEKTCMAFSSQLIEKKVKLSQCPHLKGDKLKELEELISPPIKEIEWGTSIIGGDEVVYRHESTFFNETSIIIDVHDEMEELELINRIEYVNDFAFERIGIILKLQGISVRNKSGDVEKFKKCVEIVSKTCSASKNIILCSWNSDALKGALEIIGNRKPLIYAATKDNWGEIGKLAIQYKCPVVAFADNDMNELKSIVGVLIEMGVKDIIIDPGSSFVTDTYTNVRRSVVKGDEKILNCPILGIPMSIYIESDENAELSEVLYASMMIAKYADMIIIRNMEMWALIPILTMRQNIYTDPRKPVAVEPGLKVIGSPNKSSPVIMTTNFALTYYTVASDLESAKVDCYLLVIDTDGISVEAAVAGRQLSAPKVQKAIEDTELENKVDNKAMIIPGLSARISGELEDLSKWNVMIGPKDSSGLGKYIEEKCSA